MIAGVASGLGGRFFDELRDRQSLAYTVMAAPLVRRRAGAFSAYIAMSPEKEEAARSGLLDRVRDAPRITGHRSRTHPGKNVRARHPGRSAARAPRAVMGDIADAWLFGSSLAELYEYEARVRAVIRGADAAACARAYFDPERRVEGIVRGSRQGRLSGSSPAGIRAPD